MTSLIVNQCHDPNSCPKDDEREVDVNREHFPGPACVTPCTIQVKRSDDLIVTFNKPGYEPQTVDVRRQVTAGGGVGFAGNVIAGGGGRDGLLRLRKGNADTTILLNGANGQSQFGGNGEDGRIEVRDRNDVVTIVLNGATGNLGLGAATGGNAPWGRLGPWATRPRSAKQPPHPGTPPTPTTPTPL